VRVGRTNTVKPDRLGSRLFREITVSPKKATILGLLLLVAVWFWAPLVWKWLTPKSTSSDETTTPASTPPSGAKPVALDAAGDEQSEAEKHSWKEVSQWIKSDPRMTAATDLPGRRHPFDPVEPPPSKTVPVDEKKQKETELAVALAQSIPDPESLGLVLSSTIVGTDGRAALVNGRTYRVGATIQLDHEGKPIEFRLTEIRSDSIVLQRRKKQFEVRLPEPATSGRLEITILPDH